MGTRRRARIRSSRSSGAAARSCHLAEDGEFAQLVARLAGANMLEFTAEGAAHPLGLFGVWKEVGEVQRMIVDARPANAGFLTPPFEVTTGEARTRLLLLQARAALQGLDISRAQRALKEASATPLPAELDGERLMLRVLARELAADLPGALRYAQEGDAIPRAAIKMHFKYLQARLLLQGAQGDAERTTALQLLDSLANYPLTPALQVQREELLGLAIQQTGEQEPFQLAGEEAPAELYIDDAIFRLRFARYVDHLSQELTPSAALAMLRYWRAASQRGEFLINTRLGEAVSPHSALVRAHLQFARQRLHDGDNRGWKQFTVVRGLVSEEPFRALLPLSSVTLSEGLSGS